MNSMLFQSSYPYIDQLKILNSHVPCPWVNMFESVDSSEISEKYINWLVMMALLELGVCVRLCI